MIEYSNLKKAKLVAIYAAKTPLVWFVAIGDSWYGKGLKDQISTKKKSDALNFAKSYMRKN